MAMQTSRSLRPSARRHRRIAAVTAAVGLVLALGIAGCSGADDSSGSGDSGGGDSVESGGSAPEAAAPAPVDGALRDESSAFSAGTSAARSAGDTPGDKQQQSLLVGQALIKTAAIDLKSDDIQAIIDKIYGLALTTGGRVDSEETSTDDKGAVDHSRLQVKVPVAKFDDAVARIYDMGTDQTKQTSTEDVTAKLADVNSRVESAKASIEQLRQLFDQANALGQVIRLERELSQREADLESLQAQLRSLSAQTTMSTILVTITLPTKVVATEKKSDDHQAGFVSGIKSGWDAMVTFVVGASHALGLVLPLGALAIVVGVALWPAARRLTPRREGSPQPSE
jgi:hypothetical protein